MKNSDTQTITFPVSEKDALLIHSTTAQSTKENGSITQEMGLESNGGQMEPDTKEIGKITRLMVKENSATSMVMFMMVNGLMIKQTATACTCILMELDMRVNGKMICNMVMV